VGDGHILSRAFPTQAINLFQKLTAPGSPVGIYDQAAPSASDDVKNQLWDFANGYIVSRLPTSPPSTTDNVLTVANSKTVVIQPKSTPATQQFNTLAALGGIAVTVINKTSGPISVFSTTNNLQLGPAISSYQSAVVPGDELQVKDSNGNVLKNIKLDADGVVTINAPPRNEVKLYNGPFLTGNEITFRSSVANLVTLYWNDKPQSFKVVSGTWIAYQDYYSGTYIIAKTNGGYNQDGVYNSNTNSGVTTWGGSATAALTGMSSLLALPDSGIVLFRGATFAANSGYTVSTSDIPDTAATENVYTSSIIVFSGIWDIFDAKNYTGNQWTVNVNGGRTSNGYYSIPQEWGSNAALIQSIRRRPFS